MVVLPLFWDQYDNAQRVQETGFGLRLDTYGHAPRAAASTSVGDGAPRRGLDPSARRRGARPARQQLRRRSEATTSPPASAAGIAVAPEPAATSSTRSRSDAGRRPERRAASGLSRATRGKSPAAHIARAWP